MARTTHKVQAPEIATLVWANIMREQYLHDITDAQLCDALGVSTRTLLNYRSDPSVLTLRQIQRLLDSLGIEAATLLLA